jgi:hypothetical protein
MNTKDRLIGESIDDAVRIVDTALANKWQKISVDGDPTLKRAVYFEATSRGLKLTNYVPSLSDSQKLHSFKRTPNSETEIKQMSGQQLHKHFVDSVIPELKKEIDNIRARRASDELTKPTRNPELYFALDAYNQALQKRDHYFDRAREVFSVKVAYATGVPQYHETSINQQQAIGLRR